MNAKQNRDSESVVRDIRRNTRRKYSSEEKIRIVLEGLKGEVSISELCRREGIVSNLYYRWSKDFLEAGKKRLTADTSHEATSSEVSDLRSDNTQLKQLIAELSLDNRLLKKNVTLWLEKRYIEDVGTFKAFYNSYREKLFAYLMRMTGDYYLASDITQEILREVKAAKDVEIAYPHTEVVLRKKAPGKT